MTAGAGSKDIPAHGKGSSAGLAAAITTLVACGLSLFQLYTAGIQQLPLFYQRGIHLSAILVLVFLTCPPLGAGRRRGVGAWTLDSFLIFSAILSGLYLAWNLDAIAARAGFWSTSDLLVGLLTVIAVLEAGRRVVGNAMTLVALGFIGYAYLGSFLPGELGHRGYSIERIVAQLYLGQEGIYGIPLGVAATFVFIFVLFGAFLQITGAGHFFIDLAHAVAGRYRGGPAKVAVISSAFMGSISGSAVANVVASGSFTIPLMKRLGYRREEAGGIEAAASTGGQIMPPVMGAGAFLIAEYTGVSYLEIVKLSILPALMYFVTVYAFVDLIALRRGMTGLAPDRLPRFWQVIRRGGHFFLPPLLLVYLLYAGYSPSRVGFFAAISVAMVALARWSIAGIRSEASENRDASTETFSSASLVRGASALFRALELGARNAVPVSLACALAGIIVGLVGLTGLGLKVSAFVVGLSMGKLLPALLLVALASLVLGIGLPVTASYIVLAVLTAPVLVNEFGLPVVIAHLVIFWYSQDSNVTPPVALAAFAGAAIAGAKPMKTAIAAWKYAKGLYLIPLFFVFNPEIIMGGSWQVVAWNMLTATAALAAFASALEGYFSTRMGLASRLLAAVGTGAIFYPSLAIEAAGLACILTVLSTNYLLARRAGS